MNASGVTPTTVYGRSLTFTCRPTMPGAPAKRRCQNEWLSTTTGAPFGVVSSSGRNPRPRIGSTPATSK